MSILDNFYGNHVIYISGTPGTGKTTVATELSDYLEKCGFNVKFIKINDLAINKNLVLGEDSEKFYKVIDVDRLNEVLNNEISTFLDDLSVDNSVEIDSYDDNFNYSKMVVVEGHLSHLCDGADKMIVLRLNPNILENRLLERNYSDSKIRENLEAEALAVCSVEAYDIYGDETNEIDCSDKSVYEIRDLIIGILDNIANFPMGSVDYMDWFLK